MQARVIRIPAQSATRIAGVLYLLIILLGIFGELIVRAKLVVANNPLLTAQNILAHERLFRLGIAGDLLMHVLDVPVSIVLYYLLRRVSRELSLMALLFGMVQTSMLVANKMTLLAALALIGDAPTGSVFAASQLQALASLQIGLHETGFSVGLVYFGFSCLVTGYLIWKSGFLPGFLGWCQGIAGVCYLVNSFALIVSPPLAAAMFPVILLPAFLGELATCLWMIFKGIDVAKWNALRPAGEVREAGSSLRSE